MEFTTSFSRFKNSLPKVSYSSLNVYEKAWMAYDAILDITIDMIDGDFPEKMNEKWYGVVLRLIKDLGFDITPLRMEFVDWDDHQNVCYIYDEIAPKIYDRFNIGIINNLDVREVFIEQVVM